MADILPFKAIRTTRDKASLVATRSYLTYSRDTIKEKLNHNPYTFLHIIKPDYNQNVQKSADERFRIIKNKFHQFVLVLVLLDLIQ